MPDVLRDTPTRDVQGDILSPPIDSASQEVNVNRRVVTDISLALLQDSGWCVQPPAAIPRANLAAGRRTANRADATLVAPVRPS